MFCYIFSKIELFLFLYIIAYFTNIMAYRFHEQMKEKRWKVGVSPAIRDHPSWTLQDYRDFMWCVDKGYIIQESHAPYFIINPEWEHCDLGQEYDMYAEEFSADAFNGKAEHIFGV